MSGFLPAFVAIRERPRRARLVALLLGLCHSASAWGQMPVGAPLAPPQPQADERSPAAAKPPPLAGLAPARPALATPASPALGAPEKTDSGDERDGAEPGSGREGNHVPLRYTLEAIQVRGNTRTGRRVVL